MIKLPKLIGILVVGKRLFGAFPEARGSIFEEKYSQALRNRSQVIFETRFTSIRIRIGMM
jgi:hypothetical protein